MIWTEEVPVLKYTAKAFLIAWFALPLTGGSFTETIKWVSSTLSTFSSLEPGFAFTNIRTKISEPNRFFEERVPRREALPAEKNIWRAIN